MTPSLRQSTQRLLPTQKPPRKTSTYDLYPTHPLQEGEVGAGFEGLAEALKGEVCVVIDGYGGVLWEDFRDRLDAALNALGAPPAWVSVDTALRPEADLQDMLEPYLGGDDPIFGKRYPGLLENFFDPYKLRDLAPQGNKTILYGTGAALAGWPGPLVYLDVPKNEIQFRSRAASVRPLGLTADSPMGAKEMYKRFYFVDWPVLNEHKKRLLFDIDVIIDAQRPEVPTWATGHALRSSLQAVSKSVFRVRPWFEPGVWGGQWLKSEIPELEQDVPNYAWSFELIVPENGLIFESGNLLEVSFDFLMFQDRAAVLGEAAPRFGDAFPIRFDYLDTFSGGNLSVQCHPSPAYIREHFGEGYTQDETYYILDCAEDADVYLGFAEGVDPAAFRSELESSAETGEKVDIERYVHKERAHKHDLFLIPNGTVHCSGINNLVLEISATPYIFTFKMYDWQRLDLNGKPRPLNIARAFDNLDFGRTASRIRKEFVSTPKLLEERDGGSVIHLPTHSEHFYDVWQLELTGTMTLDLDGRAHILNLVEGEAIGVETSNGFAQTYAFAETFVVPAAAVSYTLTNLGPTVAKVVVAFVKPGQGACRY